MLLGMADIHNQTSAVVQSIWLAAACIRSFSIVDKQVSSNVCSLQYCWHYTVVYVDIEHNFTTTGSIFLQFLVSVTE